MTTATRRELNRRMDRMSAADARLPDIVAEMYRCELAALRLAHGFNRAARALDYQANGFLSGQT